MGDFISIEYHGFMRCWNIVILFCSHICFGYQSNFAQNNGRDSLIDTYLAPISISGGRRYDSLITKMQSCVPSIEEPAKSANMSLLISARNSHALFHVNTDRDVTRMRLIVMDTDGMDVDGHLKLKNPRYREIDITTDIGRDLQSIFTEIWESLLIKVSNVRLDGFLERPGISAVFDNDYLSGYTYEPERDSESGVLIEAIFTFFLSNPKDENIRIKELLQRLKPLELKARQFNKENSVLPPFSHAQDPIDLSLLIDWSKYMQGGTFKFFKATVDR